ncbi:MAG: hypothetical protein PVH85_14505 [Desulfobacterales bacterium]|jgi:hypothetical protein
MGSKTLMQLKIPSKKAALPVYISNHKRFALGINFKQVKSWFGWKNKKGDSASLIGAFNSFTTIWWLKSMYPDRERRQNASRLVPEPPR